jgi:amidophosphoribosyltransferase
MAVSCPPTRHPCPYGIDFSVRGELIAAEKEKEEEIAAFIGLDSMHYLSIEGMIDAMEFPGDNFCLACYNGAYPIPPPAGLEKLCME